MRQVLLITAKLVVSGGLLYFAVNRMNLSGIGDSLSHLDIRWIVVAAAIAFIQIGLGALRWRRIAMICGSVMTALQAFRSNLMAVFFSQVLPSTVGGDAARIWFLARDRGEWSKAIYSVLLDRFVGVLSLAVLVAAGLPWSLALIRDPIGRGVLLAIGLGSIAGAAVFLAFGSLPMFKRWAVTRRLAELAVLARRILLSPAVAPGIVATSLLIHLLTVLMAWSLARAMAAQVGLLQVFLLVLPVLLIATIPVSIAGWGLRESALVLAFSYAGLPETDGLVVSVLLGAVMFGVGLIGGMLWLASPEGMKISMAWKPAPPQA